MSREEAEKVGEDVAEKVRPVVEAVKQRKLIHSQKFVTITLGEYKIIHEQGAGAALRVVYPATAKEPKVSRDSRRKRLAKLARKS